MLRAAPRRGPSRPSACLRAGPGGAARARTAGALSSDGWGGLRGTRPRREAHASSLQNKSTGPDLPSGNLPGARRSFPPVVQNPRSGWAGTAGLCSWGFEVLRPLLEERGGLSALRPGSRRRRKTLTRLFSYYCASTGEKDRLRQSRVSFTRSVQLCRAVVSNSLRPRGLQHARLPCPSPTPGAYSNSCPSSRWCYPTISSSVVPIFQLLESQVKRF